MRHIIAFPAIAASLAFAGCAGGTNQLGTQLADAAFTAGGSLAKRVADDPSLIPCLASTAARLAGPVLGANGSSIRRTNRQTIRVTRAACQRLGGREQPQTAAVQ